MLKPKIIGIEVFLEKRKTRTFVGRLTKENNEYLFQYSEKYFRGKSSLPLGPEFPLTEKEFKSSSLFPSLKDRIPSRENPAYPEYCKAMGIKKNEKNPIVLLCTIGKKGPSSFIFSPLFDRNVSPKHVIDFRNSLNLTTREFAHIFEISQSALNAFERNRTSGQDLVKRLEIILQFPEVAYYLLRVNGGAIISQKWADATNYIRKKLNSNKQELEN